VLHTRGQNLQHHPHVHCLVAVGWSRSVSFLRMAMKNPSAGHDSS
jgi:hypothetical protein